MFRAARKITSVPLHPRRVLRGAGGKSLSGRHCKPVAERNCIGAIPLVASNGERMTSP